MNKVFNILPNSVVIFTPLEVFIWLSALRICVVRTVVGMCATLASVAPGC